MTQTTSDPTNGLPPERRNLAIALAILIVAVLAVIAVIAFGVLSGDDEPPTAVTPPPSAAQITIQDPRQGATLNTEQPFTVGGTGVGLLEGNVVVQALDAGGNILVQQPTTLQGQDVGTGGPGTWSVRLSVQATPGTKGQIVAFSTSPADGSRLAQATVEVTYGEAAQARVAVEQPVQGAILDISQPIAVSGTGAGLIEGNVVVQALDAAGNVLAQQPTTLQGENVGVGGAGTWAVQLSVQTVPGSRGQIVAFSTSPADGSRTAEDVIDITYGEAVKPQITIEQPAQGSTLDISQLIFVSGSGAGLIEGNVVVQALDAGGNVLAQQPTTLQGDNVGLGGAGTWSVQVAVQTVPGTKGRILAFSTSPADGSRIAEDSVDVTFGEAVQPQVSIQQPTQGAVLDISQAVGVNGTGAGLFEGNVVVQALDAGGNVLAQQSTTLQGENVGLGGAGTWSVQLSIQVEPGARGRIVARSTSPVDGSRTAEDGVDVTFGEEIPVEPTPVPPTVEGSWMLVTVAGQPILAGTTVTAVFTEDGQLSGSSGCNTYTGTYQSAGIDIAVGPLTVTEQACEEPAGIMEQESQYLNQLPLAVTFTTNNGQLTMFDVQGVEILVYDPVVAVPVQQ